MAGPGTSLLRHARTRALSIATVLTLAATSAFVLTVAGAPPAHAAGDAVPTATLGVPSSPFIGASVPLQVTFDNTSATTTGYGPYLDVSLPTGGADGNDGLAYVSATFANGPLAVTRITCTGAAVTHPLTGLSVACPAGTELDVVQLPFGSFAPDQPPATVTVNTTLSTLADAGTALTVRATAGFQYGNDPTGAAPAIVQPTPATATLTPTVVTLAKSDSSPEGETATGPNYVRTYTVNASVAPGQTLTGFTITDRLPADVAFVSATPSAGGTVTTAPATGAPHSGSAADLVVSFPSVTGTGGTDASVVVRYWVAAAFAGTGTPTTDPLTGASTTDTNQASATYGWTPTDTRDTVVTGATVTSNTVTRANRSLAVRKSVANLTHPGGPNLPGDTLRYTLQVDGSDYHSLGQVRIASDAVSDGQTLDPASLRFAWYDGRGTVASSPIPLADYTATTDSVCAVAGNPGATVLAIDLSGAATTVGASTGTVDGVLVGGRVAASAGPAGATVTYTTTISGAYACSHPSFSTDLEVNQGDVVSNDTTATAEVLTAGGADTGNATSNPTSASVTIGTGGLTKTVYAVNGSTSLPNPLQVTVGDTVTYRVTQTVLTGNFEEFSLTDYLPQPMFHAAQLTVFNAAGSGVPPAGQVSYGPSDTLHTASGAPAPTLSVDATNNAVKLTYGTYSTPGTATTLTADVLLTVTVAGDPFTDNLFITNQAQSQQKNTRGQVTADTDVARLRITEPAVELRKGVVATDRTTGVTYTPTPAVASGVAFTPATAALASGTVASASMGTAYTSSASGFDAGDTVTFAVTAENAGHGANGAYGVKVHDTCPAGFDCSTPVAFRVINGAGTALPYTGSAATFFTSTGITLADPLPACTSYAADGVTCTDASGANVALVVYSLKVSSTALPKQTMSNTATLDFYSNSATNDAFGNPPRNFVPVDGRPDTASASATTRDLALSKALVASSAAHTTGTNLTIGESGTYAVTLTVPEGQTPGVTISDSLAGGTTRMTVTSVDSVTCSAGLADTNGVCGNPAAVTGVGTGALSAAFGTVTNTDTDNSTAETIVITYTALVADVAANHDSPSQTSNINTARVDYTAGTGATHRTASVTTRVVEPRLTIAKSVAPSAADAGDTVTFTLTVANPKTSATYTAFDATLSDPLPAIFTSPSAPSQSAGCPAGTVAWSGSTLAGSWSTFPFSTTCTITFTATLSGTGTVNTAVTNTATIGWHSLPGAGRTYAASSAASVQPLARVTKTVIGSDLADTAGSHAAIGETMTYQILVALPEGDIQNGFTVRDALPAGERMVAGSTAYDFSAFGGTLPGPAVVTEPAGAGGTITWRWTGDTTVPATPGTTANTFLITYRATVVNVAGNTDQAALVNSATVQMDGGTVSTASTATTTVAVPHLVATKSFNVATAAVNDPVTITLTVTNDGTGPAYDATIADTLASQLTFGAVTTASTHGFTLTSASGDPALVFSGGSLPAGASDTIAFTATVNSTATAGQAVQNTFTAAGDTWPGANPDQRPVTGTSNTATLTVSAPDVAVTKTDHAATASPGQTLTYDVVVSNLGDRTATGVTATDAVPAHTTFVSAPATGTCAAGSVSAGTVSWSVGSLTPAQSVTCRLVVTVDTPLLASVTQIVNQASATQDGTHGPDRNPTNNTGSDTDPISGAPTLTLTKTDGVTSAAPGDLLTYTLTLSNTGGIEAVTTSLSDAMPAHTTLVSAPGATGVAVGGNGTLTWAVGSLPGGGASVTRTVTVRVDATVPAGVDTLINSAAATAVNAARVTASDTDALDAAPDLSITKTGPSGALTPGQVIDYTLHVANTGDQDATGVVITDALPAGLTCLPSGAPGSNTSPGTCDNTAHTATFSLNLAAGATADRTLTVQVDSPLGAGIEQVTNRGTVADDGTNGPDPTPADNTDTATNPVTAAPRLAVTKTDGASTATPGQSLTYLVTVTNTGDQDTSAATVVDTLPAHTTLQSATGSPSVSGDTLTWSGVTVRVGVPTTFTVVVRVDAAVPAGLTDITNAVTVTDPEGTPAGGVKATDTDTVQAAPDLAVTKDNGMSTLSPGLTTTYSITVTNNGNQDATGVHIADTIPALFDRAGVTHTGTATYDAGTGALRWDIGDLAAGDSSTVTVTATVRNPLPAGTTQISNTATAADDGTNGTDPTPADNSATDTDPVGASDVPDLLVTKDDGATALVPGATTDYTITVSNLGNVDTTNVVVTDTVPAHLSVVDAGGGDVSGSTVTWTLPALAGGAPGNPGSVVVLHLVLKLADAVPAGLEQVTNSVTVDDGPGGDVVDSKNTATDTDTVTAQPDLRVAKTDSVTEAAPGQALTYAVTVANVGDQDATGVVASDTLDANLTLVAGDGASVSGRTLTWPAFDLAAGALRTFTVRVSVNDPLPAGTDQVTNTATAADDGTNGSDPTPANNTATDTDAVGADLAVTKSNGTTQVVAGESTTWTITVTNNGPAQVTGMHVTDPVPAGMDSVAFSANSGVFDPVTGDWTGLTLAQGDSAVLTATGTVQPDYRGTLTNTVTVTPTGVPEIDPSNNTATDADAMSSVADLSVTKSHAPGVLTPGGTVTWTIAAANAGPSAADAVSVTDTLPAAVSDVQVEAAEGWSCTLTDHALECTRALLPVGPAATVATVTATVTALEGDATNTATVSTDSSDTDPSNDAATDPASVTPRYDLGITLARRPGPLTTGGPVTYTAVVTNHGPSPYRDPVTVVLTPEDGLRLTSASGSSWTCDPVQDNTITCVTDVDLLPGESLPPIEVLGQVTAGPGGAVRLGATVDAGSGDLVASNNAAAVSDTLAAAPGLAFTGFDARVGFVGLALVLLGLILVLLGRRRRWHPGVS